MFKVNEKYEVSRNISKSHYIMFSASEISTINTAISQIYINISRQDSRISLLNSYLDIKFDVIHAATNNRFADCNDINLINLGPFAFLVNIIWQGLQETLRSYQSFAYCFFIVSTDN